MNKSVVRLLAAVALLFVLPSVCRPESQPGNQPSAETPTIDRGDADSQPKIPRDAEADTTGAGATLAAASAGLLGREYVPPDALFVSVVFPRRS